MGNAEKALVAMLVGQPEVFAVVGNRFYPNAAEENAPFPYAVFSRVGTERARCLDGVCSTTPRIRIECCGTDYPSAKEAARVIGEKLEGFTGWVNGSRLKIQGCFLDDESDDYDPPQLSEGAGVHTIGLELDLHYSGA